MPAAMSTTSPPSSPLEDLPLEDFGWICAYLTSNPGSLAKRGLGALASTSRRLRDAATPFQYQAIELRFTRRSELPQEAERWAEILDARGCTAHVRRLGIVQVEQPNSRHESCRRQWPSDGQKEDPFEPVGRDVWPLHMDDEFWAWSGPIDFEPWGSVPTPSLKKMEQEFWAPVAGLISRLCGLRDVDYQCVTEKPSGQKVTNMPVSW